MSMSTMRKYKLITGSDLLQSVKQLQKVVDSGSFDEYTDTAEPLFYGINLANDMADINEARKRFNEFKISHDMGSYGDEFNADALSKSIEAAM